ncbi:MAG: efflux RND transporter permease subunit, partial [Hyphomicrobiales bacterium]|nr:efflux RND transporter permease subunit [Hyphomicrobiales bacterium]
MNAIVLIALRRPYTFVVLAILIAIFGSRAILRTPTDIFPNIDMPVVAAVWTYNGLTPEDMSGRVVYAYERVLTTTVNNIEHIESQSLYGRGIVKIFFQPGTDLATAQAQVTAISQTVLKQLPAGITPPQILSYNASSVAVLELQVSSDRMTGAELYDLTSNMVRPALVSVPGVAIPAPYGGTQDAVNVDLDQRALRAHGLSAQDVGHALAQQNVVLPAGDQKIGAIDYLVETNAAPVDIATLNELPIEQLGGAVVTVGDVAHVYHGGLPQTNAVLVRGRQAVLIEVLKNGNASTLDVVSGVRAKIPELEKTLPSGVKITTLSDASTFVRASVIDVVREMVTAGVLTGLIVLLFLGSARSTLIVATSIPLSIMSSIAALAWFGQTINVMTLGGLALAVGILVDDATVMIENIDSHLKGGKELEPAIIAAADEIVIPTFVSTLCICIVWLPLFQLSGVAGYLFLPLAEAIVFAMIASFILSRTLVPTMAAHLLRSELAARRTGDAATGRMARLHAAFEATFTQVRHRYRELLTRALAHRRRFIAAFLCVPLASTLLIPWLGRDFFPGIKSDEIDLHFRAPTGLRLEETSRVAALVDTAIRRELQGHVTNVIDNCGLAVSGINQAYSSTGTIGPQDCDVAISLDSPTSPVDEYRARLRDTLPKLFPGTSFTFLPGDITAKILNFGLPAPLDVQVEGRDLRANFDYAKRLLEDLKRIPGIADATLQQTLGQPTLLVSTHRTLAVGAGLTEANIADNALATLSGSGQVAPTYWLDHTTGVSHLVSIQTPQTQLTSINDLQTIPIDQGGGSRSADGAQILGAVSRITQAGRPLEISHRDIMPVIDIYANTQGRDLAAVSAAVRQVLERMKSQAPRGTTVQLRGQTATMRSAYAQLLLGLAFSIVLVYLVIVVNFQSWLDPFIIITALPGALTGIVWALFLTGTTLSVPALTGAIMCMGTATANSILVVSFARERLGLHGDASLAAVEAGFARIRPVLMTALAMVVGMLPMSMSNTQNAPLGRAVIGGLLVAT